MFAAIVVERPPLEWQQVPYLAIVWLQVVGGIALLGMIGYGLSRLAGRTPQGGSSSKVFLFTLLLSLVFFAVGGTMEWMYRSGSRRLAEAGMLIQIILAAGGAFAILGVSAPVARNLLQISPRRIWALARLSFKEALRRRILLAFSVILVGFLFAGWFLSSKPEHQLATYVRFVFFMMSVFLLLIAGLLASFGIPADLKTQTMYTIVTKPVERFEIVLGRCLGYTLLMSAVLAVMSLVSLVYVARGIDADAVAESYKARVPIFGNFAVPHGVSVGREWEYRQYIQGGVTDDEAIWSFPSLDSNLASRTEPVPCEFAFDIFRTHKGKEGRAIRCTFVFTNWKWDPKNAQAYKSALQSFQPSEELRQRAKGLTNDQRQALFRDALAQEFGIYELHSKEIYDYHTLAVAVPPGLFKDLGKHTSKDGDALTIRVRCEDPTQYLGVARHDLYLLNAERPFWINFFKGAVGLWCRLVLVIVVAVTLSTYLSGIISFLTTMVLYAGGLIIGFIQEVAMGKAAGGGPFESFIRLARGANLMAPLEQNPTIKTVLYFDVVFRFLLRPFMLIIPDVERHDLSNYVAQGFDVSASQLAVDNLVPLIGYLVPWIVLAFYMMRSREIAS